MLVGRATCSLSDPFGIEISIHFSTDRFRINESINGHFLNRLWRDQRLDLPGFLRFELFDSMRGNSALIIIIIIGHFYSLTTFI